MGIRIQQRCGVNTRLQWNLRLHVQVWTQKFGRRTERNVQVKIIFRIMQSILGETIPIGRTNERDLRLKDV